MNNRKSNKEVLAKLMAKEDIIVVYDSKEKTASFNMTSRVLTLPIMTGNEEYIYDWFIAHEVSHALYTPSSDSFYVDMKTNKPLMGYFNVTEDARIEKLIKLKYPGTKKDCYKFYEHFTDPDLDFFKIKDKDISQMSLINKINLHFKIGHIQEIPFTDEELPYVKMVDYAMTPEAALDAAKKILEREKQIQQNQEEEDDNKNNASKKLSKIKIKINPNKSKTDQSNQSDQSGDGNQENDGDVEIEMSPEEFKDSLSNQPQDGDGDDPVEVEIEMPSTQEEFNKAMEELFGKAPNTEYTTTDNNDKSVNNIIKQMNTSTEIYEKAVSNISRFDKYTKLMSSAKPLVTMMVSYFNMKKKASEYQRTLQSRTGDLDTSRLADYMCYDDIFLRKDVVKEAQNHGLFFLLDWSGSMSGRILDTFKQTLILIEFCRMSGIPYELYAFTSGNSRIMPDNVNYKGVMASSEGTALVRLLHGGMSNSTHKKASEYILMNNSIIGMSGTPLCGAITVCENLIKKFQQKTKHEKTVFCILTDGGSSDYITNTGKSGTPNIIVDKKFNKYKVRSSGTSWQALTEYMKNSCNLHSTVGFYLCDTTSYDGSGIDSFIDPKSANINKYRELLRDKAMFETNEVQGYDRYFFLTTSLLKRYLNDISTNEISKLSVTASIEDVTNAFDKNIQKHSLKSMQFLKVFIEQIS